MIFIGYRKARNRTGGRILAAFLKTVWDGFSNNNFSADFLKEQLKHNANYYLNNRKSKLDLVIVSIRYLGLGVIPSYLKYFIQKFLSKIS